MANITKTLLAAVIISGLIFVFQKPDEKPVEQSFRLWKQKYQIKFETEHQDFYRQQIFEHNLQLISKHNKQTSSYLLGQNQFMAFSQTQFIQKYLSHQIFNVEASAQSSGMKTVISVDWVEKGAVLPVQNSGGMCAASYAVSSVGALQALRKIKDGMLKRLSKQEVLDCSGKYGNYGCNSGLPVNVYKYVVDHGISDDSQYPYTGTVKTCQTQYSTFKISSYAEIKTCQALQQNILNQPVSVLVDASNWMLYKSGIFSNCSGASLNLAVLLVGMTDNYWKVKNQWGASWGESGYIRLASGNCCGICSFGSVPLK